MPNRDSWFSWDFVFYCILLALNNFAFVQIETYGFWQMLFMNFVIMGIMLLYIQLEYKLEVAKYASKYSLFNGFLHDTEIDPDMKIRLMDGELAKINK